MITASLRGKDSLKKRVCLYTIIFLAAVFCLTGCDKPGKSKTSEEAMKTRKDTSGQEASMNGGYEGNEENDPYQGEENIAFSQKDYFYPEGLELTIVMNKPGKIYYTMDGTDPDEEQRLYKDSIRLSAGKEIKAIPIKAKAFFDDGTQSNTIVHTFFLGTDVTNRFDTLVFSVTTDPYNLYDYEYGIFVEGKLRADYIKEHPGAKIDPPSPANYNMRGRESEREVHLEILESDGTIIASQAAGIRTYGGWSRANLQKSIKIFTRKDYDPEHNKIRYEFFPTKLDVKGKKPANAFNRLVLRNCGNDNGFGFIRDELFQTLAGQAGYPDYEAVRPAVLFVNGEYRGMFWLHEVYGDDYFDEYYGNFDGNFEILEGGETFKKADDDGENEQAIKDYEAMYEYYNKDLTDDSVYQELCNLLDVKNYLEYYALQIYIGNEDWPHNNYRTYRYYATEGEEYRGAPFDGKWRYLFHDLDFSFGIYGTGATVDNIWKYVGSKGEIRKESPLFSQLMRRKDCRDIFLRKTLDLINGAFSPENLNRVLDEMHTSRQNEQSHMYNKNLIADWVQFDQLEGRMEEIRAYGFQRAGHVLKKYQNYFGLGGIYEVYVQPADGGRVMINSYLTDKPFEGNYYEDLDTVITAVLSEGQKLDYWLVNGEIVKSQELVVTPAMIKNGVVEVSCIIK